MAWHGPHHTWKVISSIVKDGKGRTRRMEIDDQELSRREALDNVVEL